jgi:glucoamylase
LSNLKAVVDAFRFYDINSGIPNGTAIAIGRYPEDVYYEGNPWYLNTLAVAEQLYDAVYVWQQQEAISVTETSLDFFTELVPNILIGKYARGYDTFSTIVEAVSLYADGFVNVVATYAQDDGSLDEQFSRIDGRPLSAVDLTWSYASFLTATARRAGIMPKPWAAEVEPVPDVCSAISYQGSYTTATVTIFPPSQTPIAGTTPPTTPTAIVPPDPSTTCAIVPEVTLIFEVRAVTQPGEVIKAVGDIERLGGWSPDAAVELDASDYQANNPVWKGSVRLPADETIEYKYVRVQGDGQVQWESDPNRRYRIPRSCETTVTRSDLWR